MASAHDCSVYQLTQCCTSQNHNACEPCELQGSATTAWLMAIQNGPPWQRQVNDSLRQACHAAPLHTL
eukprot:8751185-Karenia_brevis.AAC.1